MKRVLLLICLFTTSLVYSQSTSKVSRVDIKVKEGAEFKHLRTTYPTDMDLTIKGKVITVTNKTNSRYTTYGNGQQRVTNNYRETEWSALDEEGVRCRLSLIKYDNGVFVVFVAYSDVIVIYELED